MTLRVDALRGEELAAALPHLAQLRISVFRTFPYLYDGDAEYEAHYLRSYRDNPRAVLVVARDGETIVGAATGMPLQDHEDALQLSRGLDPAPVFYLAESVLLPEYRGRGVGHRFFDIREAHGDRLGYESFAFCAVVRPQDHPLRPMDYRSLEPFWRKRAYAPVPGATVRMAWKDVDQTCETQKTLQFWMKKT